MENTKKENLTRQPEFMDAEKGFFQNNKICKVCNMGQKCSTLEGDLRLEGMQKDQPSLSVRFNICPRCNATEMQVLNTQELRVAFRK